MIRNAYLFVVAAIVVACKNQAPNYCADVPVTHNCLDDAAGAGSDATPACTGDSSCSGATPVCNIAVGVCVQCTATDDAACIGTTPICGSDDTCQACTAHSQCASDVCRPDGSCSDGTDVAYVDPTGTNNTMCTKGMPCTDPVAALATMRPFVKFTGTTEGSGVTVDGGRTVTFLADPGAVLTSTNKAIVTVSDASTNLSVFDLSISNAANNGNGYGIVIPPASGTPSITLTRATVSNNPVGGISMSTGTLNVTQSTISGNAGGGVMVSGGTLQITRSTISNNSNGGISIDGVPFTITNNLIYGNGGSTSGFGGVKVDDITTSGTHQLYFNTITGNLGPTTGVVNTGVDCGTIVVPLVFSNNIIYGNAVAMGSQINESVDCATSFSDIGPGAAAGSGNISADPSFANPSTGDYHLTSSSSCIDAADPAATLDIDFYGVTRPQGSGRDIGAAEYKP